MTALTNTGLRHEGKKICTGSVANFDDYSRHDPSRLTGSGALLAPSLGSVRELHRADDSYAFLHYNQLIHLDVFQPIDLPAGPVNFQRLDLFRLPQSEVNPQI